MTDERIITVDRVEIGKVARLEKQARYFRNEYLLCEDPKERAEKKREWRNSKRLVELEKEQRRGQ